MNELKSILKQHWGLDGEPLATIRCCLRYYQDNGWEWLSRKHKRR
jgi:hypothetical protein